MSKIEWTERTWNIATGCTKVSPGCDRCYMYRAYPRLKAMNVPGYEEDPATVKTMPNRLNEPLLVKKPSMFFVCSMSDLFHKDIPFDYVDAAWDVMTEAAEKNGHIFQLLTKRPARLLAWYRRLERNKPDKAASWPWQIWAGTSVESDEFQTRIMPLSRLPAPVKFLSAEPLLSPLNIKFDLLTGKLQWIIAGGESGPGARPAKLDWFRSLRDQCAEAGIPFFLKQLGGAADKRSGAKALLDGQLHQEFPEYPPSSTK